MDVKGKEGDFQLMNLKLHFGYTKYKIKEFENE